MNIILLAPPAAGKGTQASLLISEYDLKHISTGELLRKSIASNNEIAREIKEMMNSGKLVSDEVILKLIKQELLNTKQGIILDGFPRNKTQALEYEELLISLNQKIDYVFYLEIAKEEAKARILGRKTCPKCGKIYNSSLEDLKECNVCNTLLTQREDDTEETFDLRYETYKKETSPLISFYKEKGLLHEIDASLSTEEVFNQIKQVLSK